MKMRIIVAVALLMMSGITFAQEVTKKEAVKTTEMAKTKAKQLKKEAKKTGNETEADGADQSLKAAKGAKKQAKKNS